MYIYGSLNLSNAVQAISFHRELTQCSKCVLGSVPPALCFTRIRPFPAVRKFVPVSLCRFSQCDSDCGTRR